MMGAGIEAAITAVTWIASGSVASALFSASVWPISGALAIWPTIVALISAMQKNRRHTVRRDCRSVSSLVALIPCGSTPGARG